MSEGGVGGSSVWQRIDKIAADQAAAQMKKPDPAIVMANLLGVPAEVILNYRLRHGELPKTAKDISDFIGRDMSHLVFTPDVDQVAQVANDIRSGLMNPKDAFGDKDG